MPNLPPEQKRAEALAALARGEAPKQVAWRLGLAPGTVRNWAAKLAAPAAPENTTKPGRPAAVAKLSEEALALARRLSLASMTKRQRRAHAPSALRTVAMARPDLIPDTELRARILEGKELPQSITRAIGTHVSTHHAAMRRGPKTWALRGVATPRAPYTETEDGPVGPRAWNWLTADDMTCNYPHWVELPRNLRGEPEDWYADGLTEKQRAATITLLDKGLRVTRGQMLAVQDEETYFVPGFGLWDQYNDAYGAYAIMWVFGQALEEYGIPRFGFGLEHGAWDSHIVNDSLADLGCHVRHYQTSKGKPIEAAFHIFQRLMDEEMELRGLGHLALGRTRGEYERGNRHWMNMRASKVDPRTLGVPHITEMNAIIRTCWQRYNETVSHGTRLRGKSPRAQFEADMESARREGIIRPLTEEARFRLKPVRTVCHLHESGYAFVRSKQFGPDGWFFEQADLFGALGKYSKLELRWDLADPSQCGVFAAEQGARAPTRGTLLERAPSLFDGRWTPGQLATACQRGEFLGIADASHRVAHHVLANWEKHSGGLAMRKAFNKQVRAQYTSIVKGGLRDERHNGQGESTRIDGMLATPTAPTQHAGTAAAPSAPANAYATPLPTPRPQRVAAATAAIRTRLWGDREAAAAASLGLREPPAETPATQP